MDAHVDLRHLRSLIAVAEEGSISRAAQRLHISQPPLTRLIQQLEKQLGAQLLVRTARGVEMTEAGEQFLGEARNILALVGAAAERAHKAGQGTLGRVDVGIFGSGIFGVVPKILLAYRRAYPEVNIVLHSLTKGEQVVALREHRLNFGFNRLIQPTPEIVSEVIVMEKLFLAVNRQDRLSKERAIPWRRIAEHPLVLFPSSTRPNFIDHVYELCRQDGFQPTVVQTVGDAAHGVALVATGFGICVVPESATCLKVPGVVYRELVRQPAAEVDLSCIYRRGDKSPTLHAFLEVARTFRNRAIPPDVAFPPGPPSSRSANPPNRKRLPRPAQD
jgi:LysR family transcriptional regulator, benzoate and cis,cis-muconate-responsive activator of ben and cat genes